VTLVEFLHPLRRSSHRNLVLATMYFLKHYKGESEVTAGTIKSTLVTTKIPGVKKINVNNVLNRGAPYVYSPGSAPGALLFALTETGEKYVREQLDLPIVEPEIQHDAAALRTLSAKITDDIVRAYVDEAILCLNVGALRAAVVFLWSGAMRTLHEAAWVKGSRTVNDAIKRQDPKAREVKKVEDFAYIKDRKFLDATPDMGLLDKGQKDTLVEALDLRNRCGHPTKYKPGPAKVRSFIEDVLGIVFD
jgi:hypothetical protein